jgi:hypothetical protein
MVVSRPFGAVRMSARLWRTGHRGELIEDISRYMLSATVDLDIDRAVSPFMLRGELREEGIVEAYRDHIQPWLRLEFPNGVVVEEPVGLYAVAPPQHRHSHRRTTELVTGYDHTWLLATSSYTAPFTVPARANVVQAVIDIVTAEVSDEHDVDIVPSPAILTEATTWGLDQPATKLEIVNHLLAAIGYCPLHTNRHGVLISFPLPDLETDPVGKIYTNASGEITADVDENPNDELICNVVRVINARDGLAPIIAVAENHDPASPVSIENLGRVLFREIRDTNIPDQATAELIAQRTLQVGATYDNRVAIATVPDPTRNPYDIYELALMQAGGSLALSGRWRCIGWSLGFTPRAATMTHRIGKVVPVAGLLVEAA